MDYALSHRQKLINSASSKSTNEAHADAQIKRYADGLVAKRIKSINTLGKRWVLHPEYRAANNAHHNPLHKASAALSAYLHFSGALAAGRV